MRNKAVGERHIGMTRRMVVFRLQRETSCLELGVGGRWVGHGEQLGK